MQINNKEINLIQNNLIKEPHINQFPRGVIGVIFAFLDLQNKKVVQLVCKQWKFELIDMEKRSRVSLILDVQKLVKENLFPASIKEALQPYSVFNRAPESLYLKNVYYSEKVIEETLLQAFRALDSENLKLIMEQIGNKTPYKHTIEINYHYSEATPYLTNFGDQAERTRASLAIKNLNNNYGMEWVVRFAKAIQGEIPRQGILRYAIEASVANKNWTNTVEMIQEFKYLEDRNLGFMAAELAKQPFEEVKTFMTSNTNKEMRNKIAEEYAKVLKVNQPDNAEEILNLMKQE